MPDRRALIVLFALLVIAVPFSPVMTRPTIAARALQTRVAHNAGDAGSDFHMFATHTVNAMLVCDRANQDAMSFFTTTRNKATLNSAVGLALILRAQRACNDAQVAIVRVVEPASLSHFTLDATPHFTLHQLHLLAFVWAFDTTTMWQDAQKVWQGMSSSSVEKDIATKYQNANDAVLGFLLGLAVGANQLHTSLPTIPAPLKSGNTAHVSAQNFKRTSPAKRASDSGRAPKSESLYDTVSLDTADTIVHIVRPFNGLGRIKNSLRVVSQASGTCASESYAATRSDAYRCFAGSTIVDPCFTDELRRAPQLVCMTSPTDMNVTLLTLQAALPAPSGASEPVLGMGQPWALTLTTGDTCNVVGGATLSVGNLRLNYVCSSGASVYGDVDKGRVHWTVEVWRGPEATVPRQNQLQRVRVRAVYF